MNLARRMTVLIMLLVSLWRSDLIAQGKDSERIELFGAVFMVDSIRHLDANTVRISLFRQDRIVAKDQLALFIIGQYAAHGLLIQQIGSAALEVFFKTALKENQEVALKVVEGVVDLAGESDSDLDNLFAWLNDGPDGVELIKKYLSSLPSEIPARRVIARLMVYVASSEPAWIRSNLLRQFYLHRQLIQAELQSQFLRQIKNNQLAAAADLLEVMQQLFGSNSADYRQLVLTFEKLEQFNKWLTFDDELGYFNITKQLAHDDPLLREALEESVSLALHQRAEQALESGDHERALNLLALVDFHRRTPLTYDLLSLAIKNYPDNCSVVLSEQLTLTRLVQLSKESRLQQLELGTLLAAQTAACLKNEELEQAERLFNGLLQVRPDPNVDNDKLRLVHAKALKQRGKGDFGQIKQSEIQSATIRFKAFGGDVLKRHLVLILALLGVVLVYLGYRLQQGSSVLKMGGRRDFSTGEGSSRDDEIKKRFVISSAISKFDPRVKEYESCLRFFGLPPDADHEAIKTAFRNAVKEHHPDVSFDERPLASQKFIEVTQVHDRILELRSLLKKGG